VVRGSEIRCSEVCCGVVEYVCMSVVGCNGVSVVWCSRVRCNRMCVVFVVCCSVL
jgi:hypothetical protein